MNSLQTIDSPETFPEWHMPWPAFEIDWNHAALIIVDLQNYGCNCGVGVPQMLQAKYPEIAQYYLPRLQQTVIPNAVRLLEAFRASGRQVVFTRHGPLLPDGRDLIPLRRRRDVASLAGTGAPTLWYKGTFEHEVLAELRPASGELVVDKNTSSAFNSTGLEWLLRNLGMETLVFSGMATDMCVEATARDAADRGFNAIVVEDACATFFEHHHIAALSAFARVYGQVWNTERVIRSCTRLK